MVGRDLFRETGRVARRCLALGSLITPAALLGGCWATLGLVGLAVLGTVIGGRFSMLLAVFQTAAACTGEAAAARQSAVFL